MSQAPEHINQRRHEPRRPAAFAFWFYPPEANGRASGWMFNLSAGGAAFLTSADKTPAVGEFVRFREMYSEDRFVRDGSPALPEHARVLRVDDAEGVTRRVAVRFEADVAAAHVLPRTGQSVVGCSRRREPSPPPPLAPAAAEPILPTVNTAEPIIPTTQRYTSAN